MLPFLFGDKIQWQSRNIWQGKAKAMFDNFISLGHMCPTAASMGKYGLRSWSGVFDWLISPDLNGVLRLIENDFEDFMLKINLENFPEDRNKFRDKQYNISFIHDEEYSIDLERNYDVLYQKYQRKIERFKKEEEKRNCFLRFVSGEAELEYIAEHQDYISKVIKRNNQESEIVFLIKERFAVPDLEGIRYYVMPEQHDVPLRDRFDGAEDFLTYCAANFNAPTLLKNIMYDQKIIESRYKAAESQYKIVENRYKLLVKLVNSHIKSLPCDRELIIYGAGNIGQYFYKLVKDKYLVKYFVDKYVTGDIDGIPIVWLNDMLDVENPCFVITAVYDYQNICDIIRMQFANATIISLEELIE